MKKLQKSEKANWRESVIIRDKWKYDLNEELDFPRIIQFETHSYCNASCIMCPYKTVHKEYENGYMDERLIDKIISECESYNNELNYEFLPFLMNEPLLDKRLPDIISKVKSKLVNAAVTIYTNGSSKSCDIWEEMVEHGVDTIVFSVNSIDPEEFRKITGNLSYYDFLNNIMHVNEFVEKKNADTEIIAHVLRMGKTKQELIDFMKYWRDRGIKCRTAYVENRGGNIDINGMTDNENFFAPQKCWRMLSQIHILYDGRVVLCCGDWHRSNVLGNIRDETIADIWNSDEYKKIRMNHKDKKYEQMPELCKKCNMIGITI